MKKICFVAQFPPPIHGLSKAVDTLYNSRLLSEFDFTQIDIKDNKKILSNVIKILTVKTDLFYFTISQTIGGNIRDLFFIMLFLLRQKKCILHLHGGYFRCLIENDCRPFQRALNYYLIKKVNKAIVLSESLRKIFKGIIDDNKICVVENCIDNEFLPTTRKFKAFSGAKLNILYLSNFIKEKGYRDVLELAKIIKDRGLEGDICFHFAGKFFDNTENCYFFNFVREHSLSNVVFHGVVTGESKSLLLSQCDIFILLTRYAKEGQPISILEAMGNEMAIVTTNHAGIPDIVGNENGLVCDMYKIDLNSIVDYIVRCYTNRDYLKKVGIFNKQEVCNHFTETQYINKMKIIFDEVLYGQ